MKTKVIITLQVFLLALVLGLFFFKFKENPDKKQLILFGNVDIRQVDLGFRVQGKVSDVFFEEGDPVEQGTLLAQLEATPFEEIVAKAQADYEFKKTSLEQAESKLNRREIVNEGAISIEELEDAYFGKLFLSAQLEAQKAVLDSAKTDLEDTKLLSPKSGIIITRIKEPGSILKIGDPVLTLSLYEPVWIRAFVSEKDLGRIYPGMKGEIFLDAPGAKVYTGQIGFISPVAEFTPKSVETVDLRTELVYRLRIIVEKPDHFLRQGMPVTVKLPLDHLIHEKK